VALVVQPEKRSRALVFGKVQQLRGLDQGHVVGIEKHHMAKRRMQCGVDFALPRTQAARGALTVHLERVD